MSAHRAPLDNLIPGIISGVIPGLIPQGRFMFGYNNMVVDMRSLVLMREFGYPVVFDCTHSLQLPGGQGTTSGGQRELVPHLTRAKPLRSRGLGRAAEVRR